MTDTFDFIVCGAGSAGCVLANRLSEGGRYSVGVLEGGGKDNWIWFHIPVGYLFAIGNPRADWMFKTEPDPGLNGRSLAYPRGKTLGGSSAINGMLYLRGQARDYDGWRQMGLEGWGWDDVLPYFRRHEDHHGGSNEHHGGGGEWRVDRLRVKWDILESFIEAAEQSGIPRTKDFNRGDNEGVDYFEVNQKAGWRWSAASAFLKPAMSRPNLHVETGALIERLILDGKRVTGVSFRKDGQQRTWTARREVIVATGAVATPALLERSGIGAGEQVKRIGVDVLHEMPGVGENLQDHLQIRPIFKVHGVKTLNTEYASLWRRAMMGVEYALKRSGPLSMAPSQLCAFTRSSPEYETPNVEFHVQPLSLEKFGEPLHSFGAITVSVCNLRPTSRGSIHARSADPSDAPVIRPNYLSTDEDRRVAADSLRLARRVVAAPALKKYQPEEFRPGADIVSEEGLVKAAGDYSSTIFHPVGVAKMGRKDDPNAVVDAHMKVFGLEGLRIVDASVMPTITSGNTNSPTMMIAERAAEFIRADAG
ncbi:MAG: GMC family oxidoreductase N-terminal domain-containing protein [Beijerinckiaceae bacterium]